MISPAIKLRTNTFGTRTVLADKKMDVSCRRCHAQPEILGHILGLCQYTKGLRSKRHDEVKMLLADNLMRKNEERICRTYVVSRGQPVNGRLRSQKRGKGSRSRRYHPLRE